jgi:hypothetical protein
MSRRELLRLGLLGAGSLMVQGAMQACGGSASPGTPQSLGQLLNARHKAGDGTELSVVLAGEDWVSALDNYLAFGLVRKGGLPIFGAQAKAWLVPSVDPEAKATPLGPFAAPWYGYAKPEASPSPQGINAFHATFPTPGIWTLVAETTTGKKLVNTAAMQVKPRAQTSTRVPEDKAIASRTPTVANNQGVSPICTRTPACDMHQLSLAEALAGGKPTAFYVGTPKFCMSRTCGPDLEELLIVENALRGKVSFIHAEVYLNDQTQTIEQQILSPTMKEWHLQSEPWLFLIDRTGTIASRFNGPFTADQIRSALDPMVG